MGNVYKLGSDVFANCNGKMSKSMSILPSVLPVRRELLDQLACAARATVDVNEHCE